MVADQIYNHGGEHCEKVCIIQTSQIIGDSEEICRVHIHQHLLSSGGLLKEGRCSDTLNSVLPQIGLKASHLHSFLQLHTFPWLRPCCYIDTRSTPCFKEECCTSINFDEISGFATPAALFWPSCVDAIRILAPFQAVTS